MSRVECSLCRESEKPRSVDRVASADGVLSLFLALAECQRVVVLRQLLLAPVELDQVVLQLLAVVVQPLTLLSAVFLQLVEFEVELKMVASVNSGKITLPLNSKLNEKTYLS